MEEINHDPMTMKKVKPDESLFKAYAEAAYAEASAKAKKESLKQDIVEAMYRGNLKYINTDLGSLSLFSITKLVLTGKSATQADGIDKRIEELKAARKELEHKAVLAGEADPEITTSVRFTMAKA